MRRRRLALATLALGLLMGSVLLIVLNASLRWLSHNGYKESYDRWRGVSSETLAVRPDGQVEHRFRLPSTYALRQEMRVKRPAPLYRWERVSHQSVPRNCCDELNSTPVPYAALTSRSIARDRSNQRTLYDVTYTVNAHRNRATPASAAQPTEHAIFLGCSFTFGEGVGDDQTLPFYFEHENPTGRFRAYNFGYSGYGPNDLLARARAENSASWVDEREGVIVYTFLTDHVRRAIGGTNWARAHPYFHVDENGSLIQEGTFGSARPLRSFLTIILDHFDGFVRFFNLQFPPRLSPADFRLHGQIVTALRDEYRQKFPRSRFYVLIYPGMSAEWIAPELEKHEIAYFDYSHFSLNRYLAEAAQIDIDGHPTPAAYRLVAEQLAQDIAAVERNP